MKMRVEKGTGIPISIGIAPTKALAKVANRIAKKIPKGDWWQLCDRYRREKDKSPQMVESGGHLGGRGGEKKRKKNFMPSVLKERSILSCCPNHGCSKHDDHRIASSKGFKGNTHARNDTCGEEKSIGTTRTFETDLRSFDEVRERITTFTSMSAEKLREQRSLCNRMVIFLETNRFKETETQYFPSILIRLPFPTNSTLELVKFANIGLKQIYKQNIYFKRGGVQLMDFVDANEFQPSLFSTPILGTKKTDGGNRRIKPEIPQRGGSTCHPGHTKAQDAAGAPL